MTEFAGVQGIDERSRALGLHLWLQRLNELVSDPRSTHTPNQCQQAFPSSIGPSLSACRLHRLEFLPNAKALLPSACSNV